MASNHVISGDYNGYYIDISGKTLFMYDIKNTSVFNGQYTNRINLDKKTILEFNVVNENYKKTVSGVVGRAAIGAAFLGPIGLLAGATAKNKGTYVVAVSFKNGRKSLLEIDDKRYKLLVTNCF